MLQVEEPRRPRWTDEMLARIRQHMFLNAGLARIDNLFMKRRRLLSPLDRDLRRHTAPARGRVTLVAAPRERLCASLIAVSRNSATQ